MLTVCGQRELLFWKMFKHSDAAKYYLRKYCYNHELTKKKKKINRAMKVYRKYRQGRRLKFSECTFVQEIIRQ